MSRARDNANLSPTIPDARMPNLTGDVTTVEGAVATTIADNAVTLAKMAGLARGKLIVGDSSGNPSALAVGSANEVLTHDGTDFDWAAAGGGAKVVFSGWEANHDTTGADFVYPEIDTFIQALDTNYATISGETTTIVTAGYYFILASAYMYQSVTSTRKIKILIDGSQKSFSRTDADAGWQTCRTSYSGYLAASTTIKFGCEVGVSGGSYAWHGLEATSYSVAELIFLGA